MGDTSQHDFKLAQAVDDLYKYTLALCGKIYEEDNPDSEKQKDGADGGNKKKKKKTYRFPLYTYPNYVSKILDAAGDIHMDIIVANELRDVDKRLQLQEDAMGKCIYLNHLTRIARDNKWISDEQLNHWRTLTSAIRYATYNWRNSDLRRRK